MLEIYTVRSLVRPILHLSLACRLLLYDKLRAALVPRWNARKRYTAKAIGANLRYLKQTMRGEALQQSYVLSISTRFACNDTHT